jgi:hypothetical protein
MIEKLTLEQEKQLIEFRDYCLKSGLSTERIDRNRNRKEINMLYKKYLNIDREPYIWYVDSPLQYNLIINILYTLDNNLSNNLSNNLVDNLRNNLWNNLVDNLRNNLWNNLWNNLVDNLRNNLVDNLSNNLSNNLRNNLENNLENNLRNNLRNNLWNNLRNNLWNNLGNNLENNLRNNLENNLENNLRNNLSNNLWNNLRNNLWNNLVDNLENNLWNIKDFIFNNVYFGNWDLYWIAFYYYPHKYLNIDYENKLNNDLEDIFNLFQNVGSIFFHENICFISERPIEINKSGIKLHADNKPSLLYSDGYCLWNLNGVEVPRQIVETPANQLDPKLILTEKNVEIRREILRKIGLERFLSHTKHKSLDKKEYLINGKIQKYELLEIDLGDNIQACPALQMEHASLPGVWLIEWVSRQCKTVEDAIKFRNCNIEGIPIKLS